MLTLALDASAGDATAAVLDATGVLAAADAPLGDRRVDRLLPTVVVAVERAGVAVADLRRVVCGDGPGGFTALRMAGAVAKGLVRGTGAEFWVTPSLALVAAAADPPLAANEYLVLLDALRGECYAAQVTVAANGRVTRCDRSRRMTRDAAHEYAMTQHLTPIGPDEAGALRPHARGLARLAWDGALVRRVAAAEWEPEYGRLAEAQVRWEQANQRTVRADGGTR